MTKANPTNTFASLSDVCGSGTYPGGRCAFSVTISGHIKATKDEQFRTGADDQATLNVGGAESSIGGEHALEWGPWATVKETGLLPVTFTFGSVGGPYDFRIEGLENRTFYQFDSLRSIEFKSITLSPVTIPWNETGVVCDIPVPENTEDVTYTVSLQSGGEYGTWDAENKRFTTNNEAFFLAGAETQKIDFELTEACHGLIHTSVFSLALNPSDTDIVLPRNNVSVVNRQESDPMTAEGVDAPFLSYTLSGDSLSKLSVSGMEIAAGTSVKTQRDQWMAANHAENQNFETLLPWRAKYKGVTVATGEKTIEVILKTMSKTQKDEDVCTKACSEETQTEVDAACVSFRQGFGRTPFLVGMPEGALVIREENLSADLFTPAVLKYDHPMMRRLNPLTRVVTTPLGMPIAYGEDGYPVDADVTRNSRLIISDTTVYEVFSNRSKVEYAADGSVTALISPSGVRAQVNELGITVNRNTVGEIVSVVSDTDGVLEVTDVSSTGYKVVRKNTAGVTVKTFTFSKENAETLLLMDGSYPVRWTWDDAAHDFALTRGTGADATVRARHVSFDGTYQHVTITSKRGNETAASETQKIDSINGNAVVESTSGGRIVQQTARVSDGAGLGRSASNTNAFGMETSYIYDAYGRVLERTEVGALTKTVSYTYSQNAYDRRPVTTVEKIGDTIVRSAAFSETISAVGERVKTSTDCGQTSVRTYYSAASLNRFEAGRLKSVKYPNGRMTYYTYEMLSSGAPGSPTDIPTETVTEGLVSDTGTLTPVSGKSTRTRKTYDVHGDVVRLDNEVYIGTAWVPLTWETRTYNASHKHIGSVYSNGTSYSSEWNCTGPLWEVGTDGIRTTNTYNTLKQMVTSVREGTHGTLTTQYEYDAAGRMVRTNRGGRVSSATYDQSGRRLTETDEMGRTTSYAYPSELQTVTTLPGGGTRVVTRNAEGATVSITGTAVTPEYYVYGPNMTQVNYGTPNGARWIKTFTDGLGRVVREERSGANNSTLITQYTYNSKGQLTQITSTGKATVTYTYDSWGDRVSEQIGTRAAQNESSSYVLIDGEPWLEQISEVGGITQTVRIDAEGEVRKVTDRYGQVSTAVLTRSGAVNTETVTKAGISNAAVTVQTDGVLTQGTSFSGVSATMAYNLHREPVSVTDGRGNTMVYTYNTLGQIISSKDAADAVTAQAYDAVGRVTSVTNALNNIVEYTYDVRGNRISESGATYPVTFEYDSFGQKTKMTTFRDAEAETGDDTAWSYDEATGALLSKTYADGRSCTYTLTDLGQIATRTDARGVVTTYTYNEYGDITSQTYSDGTPSVTYTYDSLGRQASVSDAVGTTVFAYNDAGDLISETINGLYNKTLVRHKDAYGRDVGITVDSSRKNIIEYDAADGRIKRMQTGGVWFTWDYLANTNLKSRLTYGRSGTATWTYEDKRDLLTGVVNHINGGVISQYSYTNDLLGRRTAIGKSGSMMAQTETQNYGYNSRDELVSGQGRTYAYDNIGNRTAAENRTYTTNNLNQYTAIDAFVPTYDLDGNQTNVRTSTGDWTVVYNAENRPIRWTKGETVVTMVYDRMGRRVEYKEVNGSAVTSHVRFLYDGYLCVQRIKAGTNSPDALFVWDPTEPMATRPLFVLNHDGGYKQFYTFDGNKDVSDVVHFARANGIAAHYDYGPFGAVTRMHSSGAVAGRNFCLENPFRFSSEYHDDTIGVVYYNYRHYNPMDGRWMGRDPLGEWSSKNPFAFGDNSLRTDFLGCHTEEGDGNRVINAFGVGGAIDIFKSLWAHGYRAVDGSYHRIKKAQTNGGVACGSYASRLIGELSGDPSRPNKIHGLDFSEEEGCCFNISVNGMSNANGDDFRSLVKDWVKSGKVYALNNPTTSVCGIPWLGDIMQSLIYEVGGQDMLSKYFADAIVAANKRGKENGCGETYISVFAHSQGTMIARRGFDIVRYVYQDLEALSNVKYCGYGGETWIDFDEFGLRYTTNAINNLDLIGRFLSLNPFMWFKKSFTGFGGLWHRAKFYLSTEEENEK